MKIFMSLFDGHIVLVDTFVFGNIVIYENEYGDSGSMFTSELVFDYAEIGEL